MAVVAVTWLLAAPTPLPPDVGSRARNPAPTSSPFSWEGGSEVKIVRVYADAVRDDEFVEIANLGTDAVDIAGWTLTDLEASAAFPAGASIPAGGRVVATKNATAYAEDTLEGASFTYGSGEAPRMEGGALRLADAGDEVLLLSPTGDVLDAYVQSDAGYAGPGWTGPPARDLGRGEVAVRGSLGGAATDTDTALDWDGMRDHRLGQSQFAFDAVLTAGAAAVAVSPDDGRDVLLSALGSATATLEASVYTLTSDAIAATFADAARRGVRVRLLLDGSPAGGASDDGRRIAMGLASAGASVRWLLGGDDVVKRYRYLHAKYAVIDEARVVVSSENFGNAGFPAAGDDGNRGWTVVLEDPTIARQLREVFDADFDPRRRDSIRVDPGTGGIGPPLPTSSWTPGPMATPRLARLVVGPDTSLDEDAVLGLLASARDSVWVEALYLDDLWRGTPSPYLEAAFDAARRGAHVRFLLDGSAWSTEGDAGDNDEVVGRINARAALEGLDVEARLVGPHGRIDRVHNKGILVDGRRMFVGSLNWVHASATENREVGLILEDPTIAARFATALEADWAGAPSPFRIEDPAVLAALYAITAVGAAASLRFLRHAPKGLRSGRPLSARGRRRTDLRRGRREVRVLPSELVAEPGPGTGGGGGAGDGRGSARGGVRGTPGDRRP